MSLRLDQPHVSSEDKYFRPVINARYNNGTFWISADVHIAENFVKSVTFFVTREDMVRLHDEMYAIIANTEEDNG